MHLVRETRTIGEVTTPMHTAISARLKDLAGKPLHTMTEEERQEVRALLKLSADTKDIAAHSITHHMRKTT